MIKYMLSIVILFFISISIEAQTFPLDASLWLLDPQQPDQGQPFNKKGTLAFNFPWGPGDTGYAGNLLLPWTSPLNGSNFTATFTIITFPVDPTKPVRFIAPESGTGCVSPCSAFFYFQTGGLYNDIDGTRWWAVWNGWILEDGTTVISVSLDPSLWVSTFGNRGDTMPAQFANALQHPTYIGVTFGGNCRAGHGVQTRKGSAQFRLSNYSLQ